MATALLEKTRMMTETATEELHNKPAFFLTPHETACHRCGGIMVDELCMDLLNSTGELECVAKRCVQCGDIVDPVILRNRGIHHGSASLCSQHSC
jgi:hypothetical protein